jgi:hypothetical protein
MEPTLFSPVNTVLWRCGSRGSRIRRVTGKDAPGKKHQERSIREETSGKKHQGRPRSPAPLPQRRGASSGGRDAAVDQDGARLPSSGNVWVLPPARADWAV